MLLLSRRSHGSLIVTLVVLLLALSFNAYACLLPVPGITAAAMENGCSTPEEQPVSQVCDAFKTFGIQSADKPNLNSDCQVLCSEDTASLALLDFFTSQSIRFSDHPIDRTPQDLLLKISVLRI